MDTSRRLRIKKKTTNAQFDVLVSELGRFPKGKIWNRTKFDGMWKKIALKVNAIGPPMRSVPEWKKVWSDLKRRTQLKRVEKEPWEPEQPGWLFAANVTAELDHQSAADNHPSFNEEEAAFNLGNQTTPQSHHPPLNDEEAGFEFGNQATTHAHHPPLDEEESGFETGNQTASRSHFAAASIPEAAIHLQNTIKSEPGTTPNTCAFSMESGNLDDSYTRTPQADNPPTAGLLDLLLGMTHSMTALVERQTAVAERQAAALERQAAATERQAAATERQAGATHAVLKLLSIQFEHAQHKNY